MEQEQVNHPAHYQGEGGMETIDAMVGVFGLEAVALWCKITAFKYVCRMGKKDAYAQDADKAAWYIRKSTELKQQARNEIRNQL